VVTSSGNASVVGFSCALFPSDACEVDTGVTDDDETVFDAI